MIPEMVYIFDVDGTLTSERYVNDDVRDLKPNTPILEIALSLSSRGSKVGVVTARPHYLFEETQSWLHRNGLKPDILLTRKIGDLRPDPEVRADQVSSVMGLLGDNAILLDDKVSNCLYVRGKLGIPYIHVKSHDSIP